MRSTTNNLHSSGRNGQRSIFRRKELDRQLRSVEIPCSFGNDFPLISQILKKSIRKKYGNLQVFLDSNSLSVSVRQIKKYIIGQLRETLMFYAKLNYLFLEKRDSFGKYGEQRVAISFCRILLKIPNFRDVTQMDANQFRFELNSFEDQIFPLSLFSMKKFLRKPYILFFGEAIYLSSDSKIRSILEFCGMRRISYWFSTTGGEPTPHLAFVRELTPFKNKVKGYSFLNFQREIVRFPMSPLCAAGYSYRDRAELRSDATDIIFENKWKGVFYKNEFELMLIGSSPVLKANESVKQAALYLMGAKRGGNLKKTRSQFLRMMIEGICAHEVGHEISLRADSGVMRHESAIGCSMSSSNINPDAVTGAKEGLADWAPYGKRRFKKCYGTVQWMLNLAKSNPQIANVVYFQNISDYFFYTEVQNDFMTDMADVMLPPFLSFARPKGGVDFNSMESEQLGIYQFYQERFKTGTQMILEIYRKASYRIRDGLTISFDLFSAELDRFLSHPRIRSEAQACKVPYALLRREQSSRIRATNRREQAKVRTWTGYWINMLGYLKAASPDAYVRLKTSMEQHYIETLRMIYSRFCGGPLSRRKDPVDSIRSWILDRVEESTGCFRLKGTNFQNYHIVKSRGNIGNES